MKIKALQKGAFFYCKVPGFFPFFHASQFINGKIDRGKDKSIHLHPSIHFL